MKPLNKAKRRLKEFSTRSGEMKEKDWDLLIDMFDLLKQHVTKLR